MRKRTRAAALTALIGAVAGSSLAVAPQANAQEAVKSYTFVDCDIAMRLTQSGLPPKLKTPMPPTWGARG